MKKWVFISITIMLGIVIGATAIYANATKPLREAETLAIKIAKQETGLSDFDDFQLYNGEETYYVLTAKNDKKQDVYLWISEKDNKILMKSANSGVKEEEAVKTVYANREPKEIITVRLGITRIQETDRPAWEIYFRTENGNINYYYVDFETGEKLRAIDNF